MVKSCKRWAFFFVQLNDKVLLAALKLQKNTITEKCEKVVYLHSIFSIVRRPNTHHKSLERFKAFPDCYHRTHIFFFLSVSVDQEKVQYWFRDYKLQRKPGHIVKWSLLSVKETRAPSLNENWQIPTLSFEGVSLKSSYLGWRNFGFSEAAGFVIMSLVTLQHFCAYNNVRLQRWFKRGWEILLHTNSFTLEKQKKWGERNWPG